MPVPTLYKVESSKPIAEVLRDFPAAAERHGMTVMSVQDVQDSMKSKGTPFDRTCQVVQVCCPQQARIVLERHMDVATVLPCRVAVYESEGHTLLAAVNPTVLFELFGVPGLRPTAEKFQEALFSIIDEVAGLAPR